MSLTIASGIIFVICATVFGIAYRQEKKDSERESQRPQRTMYKRLRQIRQTYVKKQS